MATTIISSMRVNPSFFESSLFMFGYLSPGPSARIIQSYCPSTLQLSCQLSARLALI
jgi:hypothetical protein